MHVSSHLWTYCVWQQPVKPNSHMVHNLCHWEISDSWVDGYAAIKLGRTILLSQFLLNNENFGCRSTLLHFLHSLSLSSSSLIALTAEKLNFKALTGWWTMHSPRQDTWQHTCTRISTIALRLNMKNGPIIYLLYQLHCVLVGCLNILQNNTIQNNWHLWTIQAADKACKTIFRLIQNLKRELSIALHSQQIGK